MEEKVPKQIQNIVWALRKGEPENAPVDDMGLNKSVFTDPAKLSQFLEAHNEQRYIIREFSNIRSAVEWTKGEKQSLQKKEEPQQQQDYWISPKFATEAEKSMLRKGLKKGNFLMVEITANRNYNKELDRHVVGFEVFFDNQLKISQSCRERDANVNAALFKGAMKALFEMRSLPRETWGFFFIASNNPLLLQAVKGGEKGIPKRCKNIARQFKNMCETFHCVVTVCDKRITKAGEAV